MSAMGPASSAPIPVRRATPEDAEEVVRLRRIMLESLAPGAPGAPGADPGWQPYAVELLRKRLADPEGDLAVFVVDRPDGQDGPSTSGTRSTPSSPGSPGSAISLIGLGTPGGPDNQNEENERNAPGEPEPDGGDTHASAPGALAACAAGTVEHRLPGPGNPLGLVGHVFNVVTDPGVRRRGCSRACMTALLAWYRERGVRKIDLMASAEGEPLYASLGFARNAAPAMRLTY